MIDYHLIGKLPVPDEYPSWQPVAQNATHWAGVIRSFEKLNLKDVTILSEIETEGENTYESMLKSLDSSTLNVFREIHPEEYTIEDPEGNLTTVQSGPIVTFA